MQMTYFPFTYLKCGYLLETKTFQENNERTFNIRLAVTQFLNGKNKNIEWTKMFINI